ncbi:DUF4817 domain-containing protein [Trichonephila clavipes]|nr:DUF4817 domain-containing protein [Trichonephila clavipes]
MYTNEKYCETVLLYGKYNRNKTEATRLYAIKFPSRRHPSYSTIASGCVIDVFPYLVPHLQRIPTEDVLGYALVHPESSVRDISKACSYSKSTVFNILHTYGAYPYRPVLAQELMPGDQDRCFHFCSFVLYTLCG